MGCRYLFGKLMQNIDIRGEGGRMPSNCAWGGGGGGGGRECLKLCLGGRMSQIVLGGGGGGGGERECLKLCLGFQVMFLRNIS